MTATPDAHGMGLSVRGVVKWFGRERALAGVDLDVWPGRIHALVGLNGAGKTTLMRIALAMLRPDAGRVRLGGRPVDRADWTRVGHLVETPACYPELTVREQVYATARLHGLPSPVAIRAAAAVIDELELGHWRDHRTRHLSLGNRQRVGIACALVHRPDLLVLDEPSMALDPRGVVRVREILRERARGHKSAVLVSSHHLDEVTRLADHVTVLHGGTVIGALEPSGADVERQFFAMVLQADLAADSRSPTAPTC